MNVGLGRALWVQILTVGALLLAVSAVLCGQQIPEAAWSRGLGEPLANAGVAKERGFIDDGYYQGAPLGGFGAGSIGRSYRGDFVRWHLKVGVHKSLSVTPNVFAAFQQSDGAPPVAVVLQAGRPANKNDLAAWNWDYPVGAGTYSALFPKAWYDYQYNRLPVHLVCEQFSPVIAGNYKETSHPVGVFVWHAKNPSDKPVTVSILFSWTNMVGWSAEFSRSLNTAFGAGNFNTARGEGLGPRQVKGIVFDRVRFGPVVADSDGQFAIAAIEDGQTSVTYKTTFSPSGDGSDVWTSFSRDGSLQDSGKNWLSSGRDPIAGAIAVTFKLKPGEAKDVPMALAWDFPIMQFGAGRRWYRHYTKFFGREGNHAWQIARSALQNYRSWSKAIDAWQRPIAADTSKPAWYRGMLFNELYYLLDGGTFWDNGEVGRPAGAERNFFSYMECYEYPLYSSLDVRFYSSWALLKLWPELEKDEIRQFADTVALDYKQSHWNNWDKGVMPRKPPGAVAIDLGYPHEDPMRRVNWYNSVSPALFKDINSQFVLQVYRDAFLSGAEDMTLVRYCWPAVKAAIAYYKKFDTRGTGLPDHPGMPDQSYDTWPMRGTSAYTGSLWLAALKAASRMAGKLGDVETGRSYDAMFQKAQTSFIKQLWNGSYFNFDTGSPYRSASMADQLSGQWYANLCGLGDIVPRDMIRKSLETVFRLNVMGFHNGEWGAMNGMNPDGSILTHNMESQEVWSGTTFALASLFMSEGMRDEAYKTARGIYDVVYVDKGYWFRTPEAWDTTGNFRAGMYMRPQSIWAMEFVKPVQKEK